MRIYLKHRRLAVNFIARPELFVRAKKGAHFHLPMNANSIGKGSGSRSEFPANGSVWDRLNYAVKSAGLTVAMHEWQPWHFRIRHGAVELSGHMADPSAPALAEGPDEESLRQMIIRCGVALYHLRLVLKNFGCLGKVELFPDMAESGLIAKVHHSSVPAGSPIRLGGPVSALEAELFQAMNGEISTASPSTGRRERDVDGALLEAFEERLGLYVADKAWLEFAASDASHHRLTALASTGGGQTARHKGWLTFIMRSGGRSGFQVETGRRAEDMAALGMIKTKTDDKHGWLAAGQMMAKAALQARVWQVSSRAFDQGFRERKVREELRTTIGHKGYVQAIFGVGTHHTQEAHSDWMMTDQSPEQGDDLNKLRF